MLGLKGRGSQQSGKYFSIGGSEGGQINMLTGRRVAQNQASITPQTQRERMRGIQALPLAFARQRAQRATDKSLFTMKLRDLSS